MTHIGDFLYSRYDMYVANALVCIDIRGMPRMRYSRNILIEALDDIEEDGEWGCDNYIRWYIGDVEAYYPRLLGMIKEIDHK